MDHEPNTSDTVTDGIRVQVRSMYVPERSRPDRNAFFFAYQVTITNESEEPAQLMSRHWVITDGLGRSEEVRGPGVIGLQPRIEPGEAFEYTSGCPLSTEVGTMQGRYFLVRDEGGEFAAEINPFTLSTPNSLN